MKRGSFIIYDDKGRIWANTGDAEGDELLEWQKPKFLKCIITKFGELDNKILKKVNVDTDQLITENIIKIETKEERLNKELLDAKATIVNLKYDNLVKKKEGNV